MEDNQLHIKLMEMMGREKKYQLPDMQVDFIDSSCMPVYRAVASLSPVLGPLVDAVEHNRRVPEEFRQGYNVDLKRPETWVLTFGTCRTTGHLGPQQRTCDLAYRNSSVQVQVLDYRHYKGVQRWRVPATGVYSLVASGASGGKGFESFSQVSKASTAVSVVHLNKGEEIFMVVGQEGTTACHKDATGTTRESCDYGVPRTIASLSRLHRVTGLWRSRRHRASRDTSSELLKRLRKIQFEGGGGGGGGGTFVFQVKDQLQVPLVVAAGGGGLSNNKNDLASPHGRGENHTVGHGNGRASEPYGAGPGGGWNDSEPTAAGGRPLVLGAIGGPPCRNATDWGTFGGFGGGGGGCTAGGGGGGYAGGDALDGANQNGRGGMSFTTGQHRVVRPASHIGPGQVHVIPAFKGCGCEHLCAAIDTRVTMTRCICQEGWQLMDDKTSCQGPPGLGRRQQWSNTAVIVVVALAVLFLLVVGSLAGFYCECC
ncbi:ALK tyrosine kinase receptor-like [Pollicipes pollicipes]|uniref:ALK tyrosine kinase receptor-like n=1 Tax=Pollicipes pollicipes TaxID=41117 RepID=UPI00188570B9|nr:ALK tyrosine kinase receptor-like [Pollicipes pollicipes]